MSKLRSISKGKPPLAEPPRRVLRSNATNLIPTTLVSLMNTQGPKRLPCIEETELRPEYQTISCELRALAKMVEDEFGNPNMSNVVLNNNLNVNSSVAYERGRFYDEYSARRNERLRRKKGETEEKTRTNYSLGVTVESGKKTKKLDSLGKLAPADFSAPRYSLRSYVKENKKPTLSSRSLDWSAGLDGKLHQGVLENFEF